MSDYPSSSRGIEQLPLFDNPQAPTASKSRQVSQQTKRDAYTTIQPNRCEQAAFVLRCIQEAGGEGITRKEIADRFAMKLQSVCGRVNELLKEDAPSVYQEGRRDGAAVLFAKGFV